MFARVATATRRFGSLQSRAASTLVIGEVASGAVTPATLSAVTAAQKIGGNVSLFLFGPGASAAASNAAKISGVGEVINAPSGPVFESGLAEDVAAAVLHLQKENKYTHILATASNAGKNIAPRVAAQLDVAQISDITAVHDESTFDRPMYAGNAIAKVKSSDAVKVATVRATAFAKAATGDKTAPVKSLEGSFETGKTTFVGEERVKSERPELTDASIVVSGGRALKSAENFKLLFDLADKLGSGAAVGASRAAVEAGYAANDLQVGQTGKIVAPTLYMAVGISGAIQHLAGMKDSKVIVAINKDAEAPIFQVADYGLVDDLFKAVPELTSKLGK